MIARLRILHGTLQDNKGQRKRPDVTISRPRFVVGSAPDCSMQCRCNAVSPHHCEIRIEEERVVVRTLSREQGTFVNDSLVEDEEVLRTGDHLRIGRLEFEVAIGQPPPAPSVERKADGAPASDALAKAIRAMLDETGEATHTSRLEHPKRRQLHLAPTAMDAAKTPSSAVDAQSKTAQLKGAAQAKQGPSTLPSRPSQVKPQSKDAAEAAQAALSKLLSR